GSDGHLRSIEFEELGMTQQLNSGTPDVAFKTQPGIVRVASAQRIEQEVVLCVDNPEPSSTGQHHVGPSVVLGGVPKPCHGTDQWLHVAARIAQEVELTVESQELGHARPVLDARLDISQVRKLKTAETRHALGESKRFELLPHLIEEIDLTAPVQRNTSTLVRLVLGQSLRLKHPQCLSDRQAACTQARSDLLLANPLARPDVASEYRLAQVSGYSLACGRPARLVDIRGPTLHMT